MEAFAVFGQLFDQIERVFDVFRYIWFFVLPPLLYMVFRPMWMGYIGDVRGESIDFQVIEIIPPRNIETSPQPMESIFAGLQGTRTTLSVYDELCLGGFNPAYSLEIVGTAGQVRFFVELQANTRAVFESHFYAQYPEVEIRDAEDYTRQIPAIVPNKNWDIWGSDIELVKPDPVPIKTWQHFEETVTGKMIDPMSGIIEVMGRARKGEHLWMQIIITPEPETWHKEGMKYVDQLRGREVKPEMGMFGKMVMGMTGFLSKGGSQEDKGDAPLEFKLSPGERKVLEAVEENVGRYMFRTKMRMIYVGRREVFDKSMVSGFFGGLKQFADFNLNSFKPYDWSMTYANYAFRKTRLRFRQRRLFHNYKRRKMSGNKFLLSDRELATVYHMPDMNVVAPAITRANVTQSGAPSNLPTGQ